MLGLVVATNIFQMYLFWELVGVSSYLLIGFYYTKPEAIAASKKAFIVTRFADLGFLIGILFYGYYAGTFSFTPDAQLLAAAGTMIPLALGLMFIGGAGQERHVPAPYLAAGRHGGSDPRIGPDSCGDDGRRRASIWSPACSRSTSAMLRTCFTGLPTSALSPRSMRRS